MKRTTFGTARSALIATTALLLPLLGIASSAGASGPVAAPGAPAAAEAPAAPAATLTRVFRSGSMQPRTIGINARVRSAAGVPTGTITFYEVGKSEPVDGPIPVDATGLASTVQSTPAGPNPVPVYYRAVFEATGDFADSEGAEGDGGELVVRPEPTILGLGGPSLLKLTFTTAVYVHRADGVPEEGTFVYFSKDGTLVDPGTKMTEVCTAVTDANGYASCERQGANAALMSLLGAKLWVTAVDYANLAFIEKRLPPITIGLGG